MAKPGALRRPVGGTAAFSGGIARETINARRFRTSFHNQQQDHKQDHHSPCLQSAYQSAQAASDNHGSNGAHEASCDTHHNAQPMPQSLQALSDPKAGLL
jgi:hypothetical protein